MNLREILKMIEEGENQKVEFKRDIRNEGTKDAVALLNTNGGILLFGVDDNGNIIGIEKKINTKDEIERKIIQAITPKPEFEILEFIIDSKKLVVLRLKANKKIYSYRNIAYVRVGSMSKPLGIDEVIYKAAESLFIYFDSLGCIEANIRELNMGFVRDYLRKRDEIRNVRYIPPSTEALIKIKAVKKENKRVVPTNAGILFFAKTPQKYFPFGMVRVDFFEDELLLESKKKYEINGPLWKIVEDVMDILKREIPTEFVISGIRREERKRFPLLALREGLINSLIHRNYFIPSEVFVLVFPDKIEIRNPGSFPSGTSPEKPLHIPRNPILAQYMYDMGYIEKYGVGILRMKEFCKLNGYPEPLFFLEENFTRVVFTTLPQKLSLYKKELDEKEIELLTYLSREKLSSSFLAKLIKMSKMSVVRKLKKLEELGLVKKVGKGKNIRYYS